VFASVPAREDVVPPPVQGAPPPQGRTPDVELLRQFDADRNGWLDQAERTGARARLAEIRPGRGGRGGRGGETAPSEPGRRLTPRDVPSHAGAPLYGSGHLRTIFIAFEHDNWEEELEAFYHTDVELPAT
jgi:hypothetical protein